MPEATIIGQKVGLAGVITVTNSSSQSDGDWKVQKSEKKTKPQIMGGLLRGSRLTFSFIVSKS